MDKKHTFLTAAVSALCLFLCGCAQKPEDVTPAPSIEEPYYEWGAASGHTITVWGRSEDLGRVYITRAFQRYEELTGNTVQVESRSSDQLEDDVCAALRSKANGPDLILGFGGANIDAFDPDSNFYDFSDAEWVDDLTDTSINQTIYHGKVIGLPYWEVSVSGTLYNKSIFNQLGINPPKNQEEFMEVCRTLYENGINPLYLPSATPTMLLYQFPMDPVVRNGDTLEALNTNQIGYMDIPEMKEIIEWYRTMAREGYLGENYMQNNWDGMEHAMSSGEYAMMLCWDTWLYTDFGGDASEFGLMPAFIGFPEQGIFEGPNLSMLMVNKNSPQADAALDLITFMADPYNYNEAFKGIYTAPVFKRQMNSISTPQYVETARWIEENYSDSIAWLRIKGFSQSDATCILRYMEEADYTAEECLKDMDALRLGRMAKHTH